jgi:peptidoglycan-N-acetylmuramic acid deacetylase
MIKNLITSFLAFTLTLSSFPGFSTFKNTGETSLSSKEYSWYSRHVKGRSSPDVPTETTALFPKYDCFYLGDISEKKLYLTFDEGYENGYTRQILDTLKKHKVTAAFFVVKPYITSNPDIIKRMVAEGHLVCNHSSHHPSMAKILDKTKFEYEFTEVEEAYTQVTGEKMIKYFRPPMGKYSELSLAYTKSLGYKTIFWSFAYNDWERNKQPTEEYGKKKIIERTHNGAIILLHAVSKTNANILDWVITEWEKEGYSIRSLKELAK